MVLSSTPTIAEKEILLTIGPVFGEVTEGVSFIKDMSASFMDAFGGRAKGLEEAIIKARTLAIEEMKERAYAMGANAIVGIKMDYETIGQTGSMLLVVASGTAVIVE